MKALIKIALVLGFAVAWVLGIGWLLWSLWTWVLPQLWPAGPANLIEPGYWLFVGAWLLVSFLGKAISGGSGSKG